jgi:hypothetical protein
MLGAKCNYANPADALFCMKVRDKVENRCSPLTPCWLIVLRPCGSWTGVWRLCKNKLLS